MMLIAAHPVTILQAGDFAAIAFHFRGLRIKNDVDILQAADFILQHTVGFHLWGKLQQGHMLYDARGSMAASTPEFPPPITATRLPLNSGPSQ